VCSAKDDETHLTTFRYKRPCPYTIVEWLANDYSRFFLDHPELGSIGGNTNGVNTFTGIDMGNMTGGVINGQNLLQGDNFACFCESASSTDSNFC